MAEEFSGKKFSGKTVYNGITMGKVRVLRKDQEQIRRKRVENPESEIERMQRAAEASKQQLAALYDKAVKEVGESSAAIFEVHQMVLEDEVKEAKEQAAERKKRLNALKRKEERRKNAESPKKAASDASKKTKELAEQATEKKQTEEQKQMAGKNQAAEQKQTAEQKEIPDTLAKEEEHAGEPEADLEVRQITVFDLLSGSDADSKGGKE